MRWSLSPELYTALLLQPLLERVVRYALGGTEAMVTMEVAAAARCGMLHVLVQDDGLGYSNAAGHRFGLENVSSRLLARYDERVTLLSGPGPDGGFRAELTLPLETA